MVLALLVTLIVALIVASIIVALTPLGFEVLFAIAAVLILLRMFT